MKSGRERRREGKERQRKQILFLGHQLEQLRQQLHAVSNGHEQVALKPDSSAAFKCHEQPLQSSCSAPRTLQQTHGEIESVLSADAPVFHPSGQPTVDDISFSATISACEKGIHCGKSKQELSLEHAIIADGPHVNAAISASEEDYTYGHYIEDDISFNAAIPAFEKDSNRAFVATFNGHEQACPSSWLAMEHAASNGHAYSCTSSCSDSGIFREQAQLVQDQRQLIKHLQSFIDTLLAHAPVATFSEKFSFNAASSAVGHACEKDQAVGESICVAQQIDAQGGEQVITPTVISFNSAVGHACEKDQAVGESICVAQQNDAQGGEQVMTPDVISVNSAVGHACEKDQAMGESICVVQQNDAQGGEQVNTPNVISFNSAVGHACEKDQAVGESICVAQQNDAQGGEQVITPNVISFNSAVGHACEKDQAVGESICIAQQIDAQGGEQVMTPNVISFNSAVGHACDTTANALVDGISYNAAISACEPSKKLRWADEDSQNNENPSCASPAAFKKKKRKNKKQTFLCAPDAAVPEDDISVSAASSACGEGQALGIDHDSFSSFVQADVISFSSTTSAYGKGGQRDDAHVVLDNSSAAISECEKGNLQEPSAFIEKGNTAHEISYNAAISAGATESDHISDNGNEFAISACEQGSTLNSQSSSSAAISACEKGSSTRYGDSHQRAVTLLAARLADPEQVQWLVSDKVSSKHLDDIEFLADYLESHPEMEDWLLSNCISDIQAM